MSVYYTDEQVTLHHGDCLEVLATLRDNSIDAIVTDPPYGLEFMGSEWDSFKPSDSKIRKRIDGRTNGAIKATVSTPEAYRAGRPFQSWCETWATECLRVLKPGGHMLAFGGSRTWHRLASAIEDAGFEIRDSIAWLYGSGFPKSLDVSKAIDKAAGAEREVTGPHPWAHVRGDGSDTTTGVYDGGAKGRRGELTTTAPAADAAKQWQGWGTALKPAFEPIVVARKPLAGTVAANVQAHGTGALNIDDCRIAGGVNPSIARRQGSTNHLSVRPASEAEAAGKVESRTTLERYREERPGEQLGRWPANVVLDEHQAAELDKQSGHSRDGIAVQRNGGGQRIFNHGGGLTRDDAGYGGAGGASRFFPTFRYTAKAAGAERPTADGIAHPTVKPLELMRWLIRLVTPPGGVVLDPFAGSGTVGEAAIHEHKRAVLIEREPTYLPLIIARLSKPMAVGFDFEAPA